MVSLFAKIGAAQLIQSLTQIQRKISLKNSRKNESGNGMRLTQKFLKPFKVLVNQEKINFQDCF